MKFLYVVRHAKSSWDDSDLADIDRPLNERGKVDAPRMGKRLKERNIHPDLLISSPARRAFSTAKRIAEVLRFNKDHIKTEKRLYHAGEMEILSVLKNVKDNFSHVMIFGHNPGFTDFVNSMNDDGDVTDNIPTCGIAAFQFAIDAWKDLDFEMGKLVFFDYPKSRKD